MCRACWAEMNGYDLDLENPDEAVASVPGTMIIDAKSIYDTLASKTQPLQLAEKRTALELLAYIQNTDLNGTETRWCHGEANISDSLTKPTACKLVVEFMKTSEWTLVRDPHQLSGRKRRQQGKDTLESDVVFRAACPRKIQEVWPGWLAQTDDGSEDF